MSTIEAIGGVRLDVVGPPPSPPEYSLLTIPGVVQEAGRELGGVDVIGYPEDTPEIWAACQDGTYDVKAEGGTRSTPTFDPFTIYIPITCTVRGQAYADEISDQAEAVLRATRSFGVETALSQGVTGLANPWFGDANLTVLGGGAVTPEVGLRWLERAIGQTGRQGLIHAPPEIVAAWEFEALETNSVLRTPNGTPVAAGGGYIASDGDQVNPGEPTAGVTGASWAFATGPVRVYLGRPQIQNLRSAMDRDINEVTFRAEQEVVAIWDTALQVGVEIDWTP